MNQTPDPAEVLLDLQNRANPHQFWNSPEIIIVLSAIGLVAAILFIWAAYIRKKRRRKSAGPGISSAILKPSQTQRRKSRRRLKERGPAPRNPTLAETGGLPPPKDGNSLQNLR